jgi:hypothetical protein
MSRRVSILLITALALTGILAGCLQSSLGDVRYDGEQLHIKATNDGATAQATLQVTVAQVRDLGQTEIIRDATFIQFEQGQREYLFPVGHLEPGTYKLYIYITVDGDRRVSEIRDLTV